MRRATSAQAEVRWAETRSVVECDHEAAGAALGLLARHPNGHGALAAIPRELDLLLHRAQARLAAFREQGL
jgi:hypothetical protein